MPTQIAFLPPQEELASLREFRTHTGDLVIAEIAGRDSVAAMLAFAGEHPNVVFLPTIVTTGTEYGDTAAPLDAIRYTGERLPDGARMLAPVTLFSPELWGALNGRFGAVLSARFPGWSPCAACHLYLHLMRAPLAMELSTPIVTGERDTHEGRYKLSQTPELIEMFKQVLGEVGIVFHEPIQHMHSNLDIEKLVGPGWDEGARQLECVHSGSFKDEGGSFEYDPSIWDAYIETFARPAARLILSRMKERAFDTDWTSLVASVVGGGTRNGDM